MHKCVDYLRDLATRLRAISRSCFDLGASGEMRRTAADLEAHAPDICRDTDHAPQR